MLRVTRPGGTIGMANWTPESFIGQVFKMLGKHVPPPAGVQSPALWGSRPRIEELFGHSAAEVLSKTLQFNFRYRSPGHMLDVFRSYYGPIHKAFGALDATGQDRLAHDFFDLIGTFNRASDGTVVLPSDYLEVVVTKR
jgi:hypothetical protein